MMLSNLVEKYLDNCQDRYLAPKTIRWYGYHLRRCHNWLLANGYTSFDADSLAAYVRSCHNMALSSQQNMIGALKAFGTWMDKQGYTDPTTNLVKPGGKILPDVLTPTEVEQLLVVMAMESPRERAIVYLLLDAGLRVSELAALQRRDLDLDSCTVYVRQGKRRKDRIVHFSPTTAHIVEEYLSTHEHAHVFLSERPGHPPTPLTRNGIRQLLRRLARRHEFERLTPQVLRHTCGTELAMRNVNAKAIANHLGHEDVSTTIKHYIELADGRQRNIIRQASPVEHNLAVSVSNWPVR